MSALRDQTVNHLLNSMDNRDLAKLYIEPVVERLEGRVESPIELILGATMMVVFEQPLLRGKFALMTQVEFEQLDPNSPLLLILVPQYKWKNYRSDFLVATRTSRILVECDGHNFHERTKEQAVRDRKRDREAQSFGFVILRFTGSEIYADPMKCVDQVMDSYAATQQNKKWGV